MKKSDSMPHNEHGLTSHDFEDIDEQSECISEHDQSYQ